jgi:hypothetical protein
VRSVEPARDSAAARDPCAQLTRPHPPEQKKPASEGAASSSGLPPPGWLQLARPARFKDRAVHKAHWPLADGALAGVRALQGDRPRPSHSRISPVHDARPRSQACITDQSCPSSCSPSCLLCLHALALPPAASALALRRWRHGVAR